MTLHAYLNPVHPLLAGLFGLLLCLPAAPCLAQQNPEEGADKLPFDVFHQPIDNARIYRYLEEQASRQKESQAPDAANALLKQLRSAGSTSDIQLDSLVSRSLSDPNELYPHMVRSSLFLGQFYDCGKCNRSHLFSSGGVLISEDGLALTNYHVLLHQPDGTTEGFMAMTHDGKCFEVEKILAADQLADVVLVQLKANGYKFHAAPLAPSRPAPLNDVHIVSHPSGEFFTLTSGAVSRYSRVQPRKGERGRPNSAWLEVTADFGGGSSGSGVFNSNGEVVGLVSRIRPLKREASKILVNGKETTKPGYVEMILRRCADLESIEACFAPKQPATGPTRVEAGEAKAGK